VAVVAVVLPTPVAQAAQVVVEMVQAHQILLERLELQIQAAAVAVLMVQVAQAVQAVRALSAFATLTLSHLQHQQQARQRSRHRAAIAFTSGQEAGV
jgi:hypothetical protein